VFFTHAGQQGGCIIREDLANGTMVNATATPAVAESDSVKNRENNRLTKSEPKADTARGTAG